MDLLFSFTGVLESERDQKTKCKLITPEYNYANDENRKTNKCVKKELTKDFSILSLLCKYELPAQPKVLTMYNIIRVGVINILGFWKNNKINTI